jgi:hypothetical protein
LVLIFTACKNEVFAVQETLKHEVFGASEIVDFRKHMVSFNVQKLKIFDSLQKSKIFVASNQRFDSYHN